MPEVKVDGLKKTFGPVGAVDGIDFNAPEKEITTLLGPSGCGKTTTLRCIAGLERPDQGEIRIGDRLINAKGLFVPPEKRGIGMVFQSYAIWPHMTVAENVSYGLKIKRVPRQEIRDRVKNVLSLVRLEGLEDRPAPKLSGGQQQRVSLARSLVMEPDVLLLDEPLSNLDFKLREQMRIELKDIQRRIGITSVYVTHDQTEALAISDRIIIMDRGKITQIGNPKEIYRNPMNKMVADFIGQANFFQGKVLAKSTPDTLGTIETSEGLSLRCRVPEQVAEGQELVVSIRPEWIRIYSSKPAKGLNIFEAMFSREVFQGNLSYHKIDIKGREITVQADPEYSPKPQSDVYVQMDPDYLVAILH